MALTKIDDRGLKTPIDLLDNEKIRFGTGNDLEIYHNGSHSILTNSTGNIYLDPASSERGIVIIGNGAVELYHDGNKKFETTSTGAQFSGQSGSHTDVTILGYEGQDANLNLYADEGDDNADKYRILSSTDGSFYLQNYTSGSWETNIKATGDGNVELYYDGTKKFETTGSGISIVGTIEASGNLDVPDWGQLKLGTGDDLLIYHNGTDSYFKNTTNDLYIQNTGDDTYIIATDDIYLKNGDDWAIKCIGDGAVELYHDNSKKLETKSWGVEVTGAINVGTSYFKVKDDGHFYAGDDEDLKIYHDGSHSFIKDTGTGNFYITGSYLAFMNAAGSEYMLDGSENGAASLFYDGVNKITTTSTGVSITGTSTLIGTTSWSYPKALNVQGSSGSIISLYNGNTTSYAADTYSAIELKLLTGNTGNTTGALEIRGIKENGTNGNNARALSFYTGSNGGSNTEKLRISSEGYVTKANNPSFVARAGANRDNESGSLTFTSCDSGWNISSSYDTSNSRFTAPVAGWYLFGGQAGYKETDDNYNVKFMVNGAYQFEVARIIGGSNDDSWQTHSGWSWSQLYKLAKDDYVELETAYEMHQNGTYSNFWGYLIK